MWDSFIAGKMGAWLVDIEEEGKDANSILPEEASLHGEKTEVDLQANTADGDQLVGSCYVLWIAIYRVRQ